MREPTARHGRQEVRMVWALRDPALNSDVGRSGTGGQPWPGLQPLVRIERERTLRRRGRASTVEREVGFAITSLPAPRAAAPPLAIARRGHWGIENRAH